MPYVGGVLKPKLERCPRIVGTMMSIAVRYENTVRKFGTSTGILNLGKKVRYRYGSHKSKLG